MGIFDRMQAVLKLVDIKTTTVDPRYLDFGYLEEKIRSLFYHRNLISGKKILWIREEIAPQEQFLPFSTIFSTYISN